MTGMQSQQATQISNLNDMLAQQAAQISNLSAIQDKKEGKKLYLLLNGDLLIRCKQLDKVELYLQV